jgi:hypothetical protein
MNRKRLTKLRAQLEQMRLSPQRAASLEGLAGKLGRKPVKRGKEPTWESEEFSDLRPLSIPHHGGRDLALGTRNSILNQLEDDVNAWDMKLDEE